MVRYSGRARYSPPTARKAISAGQRGSSDSIDSFRTPPSLYASSGGSEAPVPPSARRRQRGRCLVLLRRILARDRTQHGCWRRIPHTGPRPAPQSRVKSSATQIHPLAPRGVSRPKGGRSLAVRERSAERGIRRAGPPARAAPAGGEASPAAQRGATCIRPSRAPVAKPDPSLRAQRRLVFRRDGQSVSDRDNVEGSFAQHALLFGPVPVHQEPPDGGAENGACDDVAREVHPVVDTVHADDRGDAVRDRGDDPSLRPGRHDRGDRERLGRVSGREGVVRGPGDEDRLAVRLERAFASERALDDVLVQDRRENPGFESLSARVAHVFVVEKDPGAEQPPGDAKAPDSSEAGRGGRDAIRERRPPVLNLSVDFFVGEHEPANDQHDTARLLPVALLPVEGSLEQSNGIVDVAARFIPKRANDALSERRLLFAGRRRIRTGRRSVGLTRSRQRKGQAEKEKEEW